MSYPVEAYEANMQSSRSSARAVVPSVVGAFHPQSVLDFGGGLGAWAAEFQAHGCQTTLVDGPWVPKEKLLVKPEQFITHDLQVPYQVPSKVDLAVCLEVAEHLPDASSKTLVQSLVGAGNIILFSAAVPSQGGYGHVNEQPPEYWDALFERHGYSPVRGFFDPFVGDPAVAWWYSLNMVFYARHGTGGWCDIRDAAAPRAFQPVSPKRILPVIMSCARVMRYVREFVGSYESHVGSVFPPPVVSVDLTAADRLPGEYLRLINRLGPRTVRIHQKQASLNTYDSVQDAAWFALAAALDESNNNEDWILFLEDDVEFSFQFTDWFDRVGLSPHAGFYTLYQPGNEYGSVVVNPNRFYGTQCVLFPRKSVELLLKRRTEAEQTYPPGYDIRWSRELSRACRRLYSSDRSYVQHLGVESRLGCMGHQSKRYVA